MTRIHEISVREFEAWVRATLIWFGVRKELIDDLIKDDIYIQHMREQATKGDDMNGAEAKGSAAELKEFQSIVKSLTACKEVASDLNIRSAKIVSSLAGLSEPQREKEQAEKLKVDSVVLVHVLRDIGNELGRSLSEISSNLEKLEQVW